MADQPTVADHEGRHQTVSDSSLSAEVAASDALSTQQRGKLSDCLVSCDDKQAVSSVKAGNGTSTGACVKLSAGSRTVTAGGNLPSAAAAASAAFVAAKLGLCDQLETALTKNLGLACLRDTEGRCCLHYAAGYGHEVRWSCPSYKHHPLQGAKMYTTASRGRPSGDSLPTVCRAC